ncbi:hypothetical protein ACFME5_004712, partial [Escherichia coli]
ELPEEIIRHFCCFVDSSQKHILTAFKPERHQFRFWWCRGIGITVYEVSLDIENYCTASLFFEQVYLSR